MNLLHSTNPKLREKSAKVIHFDDNLYRLTRGMIATMYGAKGIGLSAVQVGVLLQVVVVDVTQSLQSDDEHPGLIVLVNPEITSKTGSAVTTEGCLSLPRVLADIKRADTIMVTAQDIHGDSFTMEAKGLFAACIQHECDHLQGILFLDHLSRLKRNMALGKTGK